MQFKNTTKEYGSISKLLHWLVAMLVIGLLLVGFYLDEISRIYSISAYSLHKTTGIAVMVITFIRAIWMLMNPKPALPESTNKLQRALSNGTHYLFYVLLFIMPISGWIMSCAYGHPPSFFGLFSLSLPFVAKDLAIASFAKSVHAVTAWLIISLLFIHIAAALKHHFINRDGVLSRMLPSKIK
jgi:cytochrome b561